MAETIKNGQTCLEKRGIDARHTQTVRSDYNIEDQYGPTHSDALSNGDAQGKGANHGGHSHFLPDCTKPVGQIDYSNFATSPSDQIGGKYDIDGFNDHPGRKVQMARSLYNYEDSYGPTSVNTEANQNDGQYVMK
jgi:hypothetical protein